MGLLLWGYCYGSNCNGDIAMGILLWGYWYGGHCYGVGAPILNVLNSNLWVTGKDTHICLMYPHSSIFWNFFTYIFRTGVKQSLWKFIEWRNYKISFCFCETTKVRVLKSLCLSCDYLEHTLTENFCWDLRDLCLQFYGQIDFNSDISWNKKPFVCKNW